MNARTARSSRSWHCSSGKWCCWSKSSTNQHISHTGCPGCWGRTHPDRWSGKLSHTGSIHWNNPDNWWPAHSRWCTQSHTGHIGGGDCPRSSHQDMRSSKCKWKGGGSSQLCRASSLELLHWYKFNSFKHRLIQLQLSLHLQSEPS